MANKMPPVPEANRSTKGPGSAQGASSDKLKKKQPENLSEQDRQGNIRQNTHNQGYQQDR